MHNPQLFLCMLNQKRYQRLSECVVQGSDGVNPHLRKHWKSHTVGNVFTHFKSIFLKLPGSLRTFVTTSSSLWWWETSDFFPRLLVHHLRIPTLLSTICWCHVLRVIKEPSRCHGTTSQAINWKFLPFLWYVDYQVNSFTFPVLLV